MALGLKRLPLWVYVWIPIILSTSRELRIDLPFATGTFYLAEVKKILHKDSKSMTLHAAALYIL